MRAALLEGNVIAQGVVYLLLRAVFTSPGAYARGRGSETTKRAREEKGSG